MVLDSCSFSWLNVFPLSLLPPGNPKRKPGAEIPPTLNSFLVRVYEQVQVYSKADSREGEDWHAKFYLSELERDVCLLLFLSVLSSLKRKSCHLYLIIPTMEVPNGCLQNFLEANRKMGGRRMW